MISRRALMASLAAVPLIGARAAAAPLSAGGRRHFPNPTLLTQDNERVAFYDDLMKGKIVLVNFFYAECTGICPAATANLIKVQEMIGERVGRDIFMYSITLKPLEDRPAQLKMYQEMHGIKPGWTLLTGSADDCELLRRRLGFADIDPVVDRDTANHIGVVLIGNERLDSWMATPVQSDPKQIVKSVSWVDR